jgi:hypothetical protein
VTDTGINGGGNCFVLLANELSFGAGYILEVEVFGNRGQRSVIAEVLVALDSSSRSSLTAGAKRYIEMHCMEIGYKPLQQLALKLVAA